MPKEGDVVEFKRGVYLVLSNSEADLEGVRAKVDTVDGDEVWFKVLPFAEFPSVESVVLDIMRYLNGLGDGGPLFVVNEENPLVVMSKPADWKEGLAWAASLVCEFCEKPVGDNDTKMQRTAQGRVICGGCLS